MDIDSQLHSDSWHYILRETRPVSFRTVLLCSFLSHHLNIFQTLPICYSPTLTLIPNTRFQKALEIRRIFCLFDKMERYVPA